jgi:hypothetical protein
VLLLRHALVQQPRCFLHTCQAQGAGTSAIAESHTHACRAASAGTCAIAPSAVSGTNASRGSRVLGIVHCALIWVPVCACSALKQLSAVATSSAVSASSSASGPPRCCARCLGAMHANASKPAHALCQEGLVQTERPRRLERA